MKTDRDLAQELKNLIVNNPRAKVRISIRRADAKVKNVEKSIVKSRLAPLEQRALSSLQH